GLTRGTSFPYTTLFRSLDVAEEVGADLIVVGATRRGTLARTILGTTAQRVVRAARVPVLVNRRPGHSPMRRVLLTTDLSEGSARDRKSTRLNSSHVNTS